MVETRWGVRVRDFPTHAASPQRRGPVAGDPDRMDGAPIFVGIGALGVTGGEGWMRLFVGIPLAEAVTEEVAALTARLKRKDDGLRWSAPESWHITLQFLGSTTEEQYGCVTAALGGVAGAPVAVQLTELGVFERAGVFHVDVALTAELAELQRRVTRANEACGFVAEARTYHPHITLARIQRKAGRGTKTGRGQALREGARRESGRGSRVLLQKSSFCMRVFRRTRPGHGTLRGSGSGSAGLN